MDTRIYADAGAKLCALRRLLTLLLITGLAGCVALDTHKLALPQWDGPPTGEATQVMVLWADGVDIQPDPTRGGMPTPGFAGRIYLFGRELGQPLAAEGCMVVYLYDDAQPQGAVTAPREVWTIDEANLQRVLKKDGLGWGYNLWLPWSNYRPDIKKVGLAVCYKPKQGNQVWSGNTILAIGGQGGPKRPSKMQTRTTAIKP